jgi:hypothetical protein
MSKQQVQELSGELSSELAKILKTPEEHFTFERIESDFFYQGKSAKADPLIEVHWFRRSQKLQDLCAQKIDAILKDKMNIAEATLVFVELSQTAYYEKGQHFGPAKKAKAVRQKK